MKMEYSKKLLEVLYDFQQTGYLCDTVLIADDRQLKAHSAVLAAASPLFFQSIWTTDSATSHEQALQFTSVRSDVLNTVLKYIYTGHVELSSSVDMLAVTDVCESLGLSLPAVSNRSTTEGKARRRPQKRSNKQIIETDNCTAKLQRRCMNDVQGSHLSIDANSIKMENIDASHPNLEKHVNLACDCDEVNYVDAMITVENYQVTDISSENNELMLQTCPALSRMIKQTRLEKSLSVADDSLKEKCALRGMENARSSQKSLCELCGKNAKNIVAHRRTHTADRPYVCDTCGRRFSLRQNLTRHERQHSGNRPYLCFGCGRGFIQRASLIEHMAAHHPDLQSADHWAFRCRLCGERFARRILLHRHTILTHQQTAGGIIPERRCRGPYRQRDLSAGPLTCSFCSRVCLTRQALENHVRTHTGDRPYSCSHCGKRFRQLTHLQIHMRTHTGEMPFSCTVCAKKYRNRVDLRVHCLRVHHVELPVRKRRVADTPSCEAQMSVQSV